MINKFLPRKVYEMEKFMSSVKETFKKCLNWIKTTYKKCASFTKEKLSKVNWKVVWDKFTTGLLIFLMASPLLILGYILLWFVLK